MIGLKVEGKEDFLMKTRSIIVLGIGIGIILLLMIDDINSITHDR